MDECVFCQIVEGNAPASVVYSDATVMAFMDIAPIVPGHLLVIPKRHAVLMGDLEGAEGPTCWMIAAHLAKALRGSGLRVEGVNLFVADGGPFVTQADKNPTWTILALAWRTADYIAQQRKQGAL